MPSEESFKIIRADWIKTVMLRNELRQNDDCTGKMIEMFPLSMAFDGSLVTNDIVSEFLFYVINYYVQINLDFDNMFPSANKDEDVLGALQGKILDKFNHLHPTIDDRKKKKLQCFSMISTDMIFFNRVYSLVTRY